MIISLSIINQNHIITHCLGFSCYIECALQPQLQQPEKNTRLKINGQETN